MADENMCKLVNQITRAPSRGVGGIEDDDVSIVARKSDGGPTVAIVMEQCPETVRRQSRDFLYCMHDHTKLLRNGVRVDRGRKSEVKMSPLLAGDVLTRGFKAAAKHVRNPRPRSSTKLDARPESSAPGL